ncbi:hypothetical protein E4U10_001908 [Claviceps purpurea]|nr:hypothetical protein E4U10_001908 [Claviceps purpurea]
MQSYKQVKTVQKLWPIMHMTTTFIGGVVIERSATALECGFKFDMEGLDAGARRQTRELPAKP